MERREKKKGVDGVRRSAAGMWSAVQSASKFQQLPELWPGSLLSFALYQYHPRQAASMFHWLLLNEQVPGCLEVYFLGKTDIVEQIDGRHDFQQWKLRPHPAIIRTKARFIDSLSAGPLCTRIAK